MDDLLAMLFYLIIGLHLAAIPIYIVLLWKRPIRAAAIWLAFLFLESIAVTLWSVYTGGMFGPGTFVVCLSPFTVAISFLLLFIFFRRFNRAFEGERLRRMVYLIGGLIVVALQVIVFAGHYGVKSACFARTRRRAAPVIDAVEAYRRARGDYPHTLDDLVPSYLQSLPAPACEWLRGEANTPAAFALERCRSGETLLIVDSVDAQFIRRYDLGAGGWATISFLDGACSFLK